MARRGTKRRQGTQSDRAAKKAKLDHSNIPASDSIPVSSKRVGKQAPFAKEPQASLRRSTRKRSDKAWWPAKAILEESGDSFLVKWSTGPHGEKCLDNWVRCPFPCSESYSPLPRSYVMHQRTPLLCLCYI